MYLYQHSSPDPRCDGFTSTTTTSWQMEVKMGNGNGKKLLRGAKCEVQRWKSGSGYKCTNIHHLCACVSKKGFFQYTQYIFSHVPTRRQEERVPVQQQERQYVRLEPNLAYSRHLSYYHFSLFSKTISKLLDKITKFYPYEGLKSSYFGSSREIGTIKNNVFVFNSGKLPLFT